MGMEIKINAGDMLKVLVNSGMDATDAKAIIFDLLQYPEGIIPERRKLTDIKKQRMKKRVVEVDENDGDGDDDDEQSDDDDEEEEEEDEDDRSLATKIRRPKRINFKNFGGSAQAIHPVKRG